MNDDGAATPAAGRRPNGALEAEVLAILQAAEEALTPAQAAERLGGGLSYSTVVTILSRLHAKGVLERAPRGRAYAYAPVTDAPGLAARQMHQVLGSKPDREKVLTRFVDDLSADDEQLLRRLLGAELDPGQ
ncbi:BlaI/MecI/CopY family transcriptional regulator [Streptomyces sp. SID13666]|uniref:BlaI/MecI/CopY family transcriptional regulator n=1 Tax=unclassified Streptomyces TaxID=2593676 RepID=UPI0013BFB69C|nr:MULTISPECIES: BlaI/MecI/CopY family transcriptional regulator [unclassified Streptomyces]NEA54219.1 BlaI/MecI/CopY family transcriptional regulator [Streptomyces sp. SID13666]NEA70314.1 BlaI/MecI/CopY family transcriptional regulator [Streptomyces sp. SID13588]